MSWIYGLPWECDGWILRRRLFGTRVLSVHFLSPCKVITFFLHWSFGSSPGFPGNGLPPPLAAAPLNRPAMKSVHCFSHSLLLSLVPFYWWARQCPVPITGLFFLFSSLYPKCKSLKFIVEFSKSVNMASAEFRIPEGLVVFNPCAMEEC